MNYNDIYCTNKITCDGFGSQYQTIISSILYATKYGYTFVFSPVYVFEHNYEGDPNFCEELNQFMNLTYKYQTMNTEIENVGVYRYDASIKYAIDHDIDGYATDDALKPIKECFWQNKDRNVFKNNRFNIVVHVRRPNSHDNRVQGTNTPDEYYLKYIDMLREKHKDKNPLFHIHSQGTPDMFEKYEYPDTIIKLNIDLKISFTEMVAADALILSASSFSYVAAFLCDGDVYYMPFWHSCRSKWIRCS